VLENEKESLLKEAERIAGRGMRVLMVAEGSVSTSVDDPQDLTVLGFLGIRDPMKQVQGKRLPNANRLEFASSS